jgi:hypothetical protein
LGDAYAGVCLARAGEVVEPSESRQVELCNRGYARGACECFPAEAVADAVRFSVVSETDGRVRLVWVRERDHAPVEHGEVVCAAGQVEGASGLLEAQARAFVESFRRR